MSTAAGDSPCRSTSAASVKRQLRGMRAEFECDRDAGIEMDAGERAFDRVRPGRKPVAMRADRAGRDQHQPVGAVVELVQHFGVAGVRVGMVDALHDLPARAGRASGNRRRVARARIERLDGQAVGAPALQRFRSVAPFSTPSTSLRHCAWVAAGNSAASGRSSASRRHATYFLRSPRRCSRKPSDARDGVSPGLRLTSGRRTAAAWRFTLTPLGEEANGRR